MSSDYYNQISNSSTTIIRSSNVKPVGAKGTFTRHKNLDQAMSNKFRKFVETDWNTEYMYTPSDFIEMFGITRHLSRYYLMDLVYEKKLYRVKYLNKTWYDKVNDEQMLSKCQEFIWMGVDVTI